MHLIKKISLVMLIALVHTMHHAACMSKLKDLWGSREKSASPKSESKQPDSGSSSNRAPRSYETTRSNLDELGILGKSSRSPREQPENKREREEPREGRSLLQRARETLSRGRGDSKRERDIEISGPSNFRVTTDESLARMNPEDAEKIRKAKIAAPLESAKWKKKEIPYELEKKAAQREKMDERLGSGKLSSGAEVKEIAIEERQKQIQEIGTKIQEERKRQADLSPDEKERSKTLVKEYEKEIKGLEKGKRELQEKERVSSLSLDQQQAEVNQLKQQAEKSAKAYANAQKSSDEMDVSIAKSEYRKAYLKAKIAETKLEERLGLQEAEKKSSTKKSARFEETIETSDRLQKKEPLPANAQPTKSILKTKRVGFADDTQSTGPEKNVGFSVDQKSFEEFQKRAGPPPSKLPPLPAEAEKTKSDDLSPAMKRKSTFEEEKFNQKSSKSTPSTATGDTWIETVQDSPIKSKYGELTPQEKKARLQEIYESNAKLIEQEKTR